MRVRLTIAALLLLHVVALHADDAPLWRFDTHETLPFITSPATAGKRILVADNKGKLFALDVATGATLWSRALPTRANTALVVVGKNVVVGTENGDLNWIATDSGEIAKHVHLAEGLPYGTPILAPPLLYVLAAGAKGNR